MSLEADKRNEVLIANYWLGISVLLSIGANTEMTASDLVRQKDASEPEIEGIIAALIHVGLLEKSIDESGVVLSLDGQEVFEHYKAAFARVAE